MQTMPTSTGYPTENKCLDEMPRNGYQLWGRYVRSLVFRVGPLGHDVNLPINRLAICMSSSFE